MNMKPGNDEDWLERHSDESFDVTAGGEPKALAPLRTMTEERLSETRCDAISSPTVSAYLAVRARLDAPEGQS